MYIPSWLIIIFLICWLFLGLSAAIQVSLIIGCFIFFPNFSAFATLAILTIFILGLFFGLILKIEEKYGQHIKYIYKNNKKPIKKYSLIAIAFVIITKILYSVFLVLKG